MKVAQTERGKPRGDATKTSALFTHFLTQKLTPLSTTLSVAGFPFPLKSGGKREGAILEEEEGSLPFSPFGTLRDKSCFEFELLSSID